MPLTTPQLQALKTAITGNPVWNAFPNTADGNFNLAAAMNATAVPDFFVWRTDVRPSEILAGIDLSKYTPNDTILDTDSGDALQRKNGRLLTAQTKQMNLQMYVMRSDSIDMRLPSVRAGLRDAVISLPTGAAGAATSPGGASGATVLANCIRKATEGERILCAASNASDTTGSTTARVMVFEGSLSAVDVETARNLA